jgi:hypothetical protein
MSCYFWHTDVILLHQLSCWSAYQKTGFSSILSVSPTRQSCFQHRLVIWCWYAVNYLMLSVGRYTVLWWSVIPSWCMSLTAKPLLTLKSYCGIFRDVVTSIALPSFMLSLLTGRPFPHFSSTKASTFLKGALEYACLGPWNAYGWSFFFIIVLCVFFSNIQFSWHRICVLWHSNWFVLCV